VNQGLAQTALSADALDIDPEQVTDEIVERLRTAIGKELRRKGAVVGLSGGIDSTVTCALCARALGPERVLAVLMPEADSDPGTLDLSRSAADSLGVESVVEEITPILEALGCYKRRDDAVRKVIPEFGTDWKMKIVLPSVTESDALRVFSLVVESPDGESRKVRLPADPYLEIVATTNFKQRTRKMLEYYHADRLNYAVAGTPNRLEYDQGFFVKNGDGAADVKPIAHLYKTQVYALAEQLGVPESIRTRPPTTDTYSLPQSQEEFYFSLPYREMDLCLYAHNQGLAPEAVADAVGLAPEEVARVYRDIDQKRRTTRYLQLQPLLLGPVPEITH
jgi:NAD+ synthase